MHWRRQDSDGIWSEKLPGKTPCVCDEQDQSAASSVHMNLQGFFWVQTGAVVAQFTPKGCCVIL